MIMLHDRDKIFIFLLFAGYLFLMTAGPILAQEGVYGAYHKAAQTIGLEKDPAKDPICWQKEVCFKALQQQFPDFIPKDDNWQSPGPNNRCGSDLGVCLPAGTTDLEIKIGQTANVKDLGDYIKTIYVYLLSIGGIVAAVLLIKSGADWMMGGVSAEGIKNAQATIVGAITGLLLLLGSYVLLYTINPNLVNLKLPQVYMVRPVELIDMAEGQPCWEKDVTNVACVGLGALGEYACHPIHKNGLLMDLVYSEISIIMTSAIPITGGSIVGAKVGEWVVGGVSKAVGKYVGYFFKAPAGKLASIWGKYFPEAASKGTQLSLDFIGAAAKKDTTWITTKKIAQAVFETAKEGKMAVAKIGALGPAVGFGALAGSVIVPDEIYDLLYGNGEKGFPGICEKSTKLSEGMFCNALIKPSDCASGACVEVIDWSGWVTDMKIGVCSSGGAGNPCNKVDDCGTDGGPFKCLYDECTDFTFGRTCVEDSQCKNNLKCLMGGDGKNRCKSEEAAGLGGSCQTASGNNDEGKCENGLDCLSTPGAMSASYSVCTDHKINSPCYKDEDCAKDSDYFVICAGSKLKGQGQSQFVNGKCFYGFFNAYYDQQGMEISSSNASDVSSETVGCSANNDCPNAQCWETYQGNKICAGP